MAMTPEKLDKLTKPELLELARSRKIRVSSRMLKSELIKALSAGKRPAAKARPKPKKPSSPKRAPAAAPRARAGKTSPVKGKRRVGKAGAAPKKGAAPRPKRVSADKAAKPKGRGREKMKEAAPSAKAAPRHAQAREPSARMDARTIRQKVETGKYYLGAEEHAVPPVESIDIPSGYDVDRIVLMVRDPHWIFAYWEVTQERYITLEKLFGEDWLRCKMILRISDKSSAPPARFDIELNPEARNWYIRVSPERRYQVSIGALGPRGRFEEVAASNIVETPRSGVSDVTDERWMVSEELFERILAESGGGPQAGSAEIGRMLEKRLAEQIGSGAVSSFGSGALRREAQRKFRLWVAADLILYGATEPDAKVTVRGEEIKLRPDGTFSLRLALPDGRMDLPVKAASADGVEERALDTTVDKKSDKKEPVLK